MKVRSSIKKICPSCKLVQRGRKVFIICPVNTRHKQRQGFSTVVDGQLARMGDAYPAEPVVAGAVRPEGAAFRALLSFSFGDFDDDL